MEAVDESADVDSEEDEDATLYEVSTSFVATSLMLTN